jgi:hypothetical protein
MSPIILYDLAASKTHCRCWSYNPWKGTPPTRLIESNKFSSTGFELQGPRIQNNLARVSGYCSNVKPAVRPSLRYETLQTDSPSVTQNPLGIMPYTIPTVQFPDGTYIMD